ncbi:MAG: asparagine synthase (glutamine-hydrolyzing) [Candidatus Vecturithrix sp.]|jgi:asparagine synthase (glutamine-hydrolysing)|nr:asparagine synthase (glutamine-hydrolyzing) [Candidatus Vecturithrix sp.]
MCGIAGYLDLQHSADQSVIESMTRILHHRGPDGEGYHLDGALALGHRRLSIIDLAGGKQPMSDDSGRYWITFNGEIYNFPLLREQLMKQGHRFATRSDTETILAAYKQYGENCVDHLRGMFAFAIWDSREQTLFLARDRIGKKPLYYHFSGTRFVFASEIKAILQYPGIGRDLDQSALADYLQLQYVPFPKTIFRSIHKLPPGFTLRVTTEADRLKLTERKYWDLHYEPDYSRSERDWCELLRDKLAEAVRIRMISEVPLGAFLSGGVDSSAVVAFMAKSQSAPVKTFSIGFKEEDFSETRYARQVAEQFGTEHHEFIVEPDAMEMLPKLAWEFDEPFADSSAVPTYYVSKLAREHVTVILSGDGGDETFAGYGRYPWAVDMTRYDILPDGLKRLIFGVPSALMPDGMRGKGMLRHLSKNPFGRYAGLVSQGEPGYFRGLFSDAFKHSLSANYSADPFLQRYYDSCNSSDYLTRLQYLDTKTYLAEDIMTKVDRASMLCSLETRAPLLDHEFLELAAKIPAEFKLKNGITKYIFKKSLEGILPDNILYRKKMGFGVPLVHWFKGDLVDYSRDILFSTEARQRGFFNMLQIEKLLDRHQKAGRDLSPRIWGLLFFEHWCRNWL